MVTSTIRGLSLVGRQDSGDVIDPSDVIAREQPSVERREVAAAGDAREVIDILQQSEPAQCLEEAEAKSRATDSAAGKPETNPFRPLAIRITGTLFQQRALVALKPLRVGGVGG